MKHLVAVILPLFILAPACALEEPPVPRTLQSPATQPTSAPSADYILHLPGIGGLMRIDGLLAGGLREGGIDAQIDVYDWTNGSPGLVALTALERNREEAKKVSRMIQKRLREHPGGRITLTGHSAGAGIAVWALEDLPDDAKIHTLVLLAPALSPNYDLTAALRHVGRAYVFISEHDPVLGAGTRTFGTIDRVMIESAGRVGFTMPDTADAAQYDKLTSFPYDKNWMRFGNIGDHIGPMMRPFARRIIAPLLLTGRLPVVTTQPSSAPAR